ncbi:MAG: DUF2735 domain-containing protein [Pseudolabrys sp.]
MPTNVPQASAKIIQFPVGGRARAGVGRDAAKLVSDVASLRVSEVASGGNWYHEAAIQEAKRTPKRTQH